MELTLLRVPVLVCCQSVLCCLCLVSQICYFGIMNMTCIWLGTVVLIETIDRNCVIKSENEIWTRGCVKTWFCFSAQIDEINNIFYRSNNATAQNDLRFTGKWRFWKFKLGESVNLPQDATKMWQRRNGYGGENAPGVIKCFCLKSFPVMLSPPTHACYTRTQAESSWLIPRQTVVVTSIRT